MKLVHWPLMGKLLHLVQRGGAWVGRGRRPAQSPSLCTKCNSPPVNGQCTNHRNGPLSCGYNVGIKRVKPRSQKRALYAMMLSTCLLVCLSVCLSVSLSAYTNPVALPGFDASGAQREIRQKSEKFLHKYSKLEYCSD